MASGLYAFGIKRLAEALIDWDGATVIKAMLVKDTYAHDNTQKDTFEFLSNLKTPTDFRASQGSGDVVIGTRSVEIWALTNEVELRLQANATFSAVGIGQSVKGVALYTDEGGVDTARRLICWLEFATALPGNGSDIQVTFGLGASGLSAAAKFSYV